MASLRRRRRTEEAQMATAEEEEEEEDQITNGTTVLAEDSGSSSSYHSEPELQCMTAKGIKHLCSELLEINKASEEDFQRNVYLSYLSFVREAGDLQNDVGHLRQHAIAQRRLVQDLTKHYSSLYSSSTVATELELDQDLLQLLLQYSSSQSQVELELDELLSEHRMDEAMGLLEQQGQALERMQMDGVADDGVIASCVSALSASKARVADRFASAAEHPRTPRPELLEALSGLCRLGDAQRANHLLFRFYGSADSGRRRTTTRSPASATESSSTNYIKELAHVVFSSILEASRSFVALHGRPSPYAAELARWAREEIQDFGVALHEFVLRYPMPGESLALALEAARCAASYCSLLRPDLDIAPDLMEVLVPCMEEALAMYGKHLKEVIRLLVASDHWVLGRFLSRPQSLEADQQQCYCLLTTGGRKFVTLMQEAAEDVSPLLDLHLVGTESRVVQLLAELFRAYMHSIVPLFPADAAGTARQGAQIAEQQHTMQLFVLINCTTLVSLFPSIAGGVFKSKASAAASITHSDFSPESCSRDEMKDLILSIKEAAGEVWSCFCQQFIRDTMSSLLVTKPSNTAAQQPQGMNMMPSSAFQVLFLRVRQLNNLYGTILSGKDGTMRKLLQQLMEAMILWLSDNLDSWIQQAHGTPLLEQIQLDVHFLLQFAELGGFSSDSIINAAFELLGEAEEKVPASYSLQVQEQEEGWATDAAKHAIRVLLLVGTTSSQSQEEDEAQTHTDADHDSGKSTDEFVSIEEDERGAEGMPWPSSESSITSVDSASSVDSEHKDDEENNSSRSGGYSPEDSSRRAPTEMPQANTGVRAAAGKGSSRRSKTKEAITMNNTTLSSRPRWQ